jgi:uncharacterized damage-inducible protein DinB
MIHPLVLQLRFTRSEWLRALDGLSEEDATRRLLPSNSISWIVGHLAWQEQRYWLTYSQQTTPLPHLNETVANGKPATVPTLAQSMEDWRTIIGLADPYLDTFTTQTLESPIELGRWKTTVGSLLLRVIYHYWYHIGEIMLIRQQLGQTDLPQFVGDLDDEAPYVAEA